MKSDYKGTPVIQSDAAITHGNSGGPAFNDAGEVIGIATFTSAKEVAGFNFFVPINTAWEFVRQAGSNPEAGLFNQVWAQALDVYDAGKCYFGQGKVHRCPAHHARRARCPAPDGCRRGLLRQPEPHREDDGRQQQPGVPVGAGVVLVLLALFLVMRKKPAVAGASAGPAIAGAPQPGAFPPPSAMPPPGLPSGPAQSFGSVQVTSGPLSGRRFPITKQGLLIGRDAGKCQVVLNEDTVSKEHAWIVPVDSGVVVIDRGSANGTFVNSTESPRVSKVGLQNGDRVYIGKQGAAVLTYFSS